MLERTSIAVRVAVLCAVVISSARSQTPSSAQEQAQRLLQAGQAQAAIALLQPQVRSHPQDLRMRNLLGIALSAAGDSGRAGDEFRACIKLDPKFRPAYKNLAINELKEQHYDVAGGYLAAAMKLGPTDPEIRALQGELAYQRKQYSDAISGFEAGRAYAERDQTLALHFVDSYTATGQDDRAIELLKALGPATQDPELRFRTGVVLAKRQKLLEALPYFLDALRAKPGWHEARYDAAVCQLELGKITDAIATLERSGGTSAQQAELDNLLARAYSAAGQKQKAIDTLQSAITLAPDREENYLDLGTVLFDASRPDLALKVIDEGLHRLKSSSRLHLARGVMLTELGDRDAARTEFEAAARAPESKRLATTAIGVNLESKDQDAATRFFMKQASQHEDDFLFQYLFAMLLLSNGPDIHTPTYLDAKRHLTRSIELNPAYAKSRIELGKLYLGEGHPEQAIQELKAAESLDRGDRTIYAHLMRAYRLSGKSELARQAASKLREVGQTQGPASIQDK